MQANISETIKACIHCGICLPACPTYQVTGNEGHSPRGRLYLINELINSSKSQARGSKPELIDYLDSCLTCSACETVCPSGVDYINILEYARHDLALNNYNKGLGGFIRKLTFKLLLPSRKLMNMLRVFARFLPLKLFNKLAPSFDFKYKEIKTNYIYKSDKANTTTVSLPLGCVMDTAYNDVHWDTIEVLNALGYDVYIPETQCCGALAYHSGEVELGKKSLTNTLETLSQNDYPVVMNSAGCGAFLKNHSDLPVMDLIEALKDSPSLRGAQRRGNLVEESRARIDLSSIGLLRSARNDEKIRAVYHPACHLNHQQGVSDQYIELLKQIPNLELWPLYEADLCCGSAGFYNLIESKMADQIGRRKAENIKSSLRAERSNPAIVLTANPGCMSQIQAHLGDEYKVMHPVSLIKANLQKPQQL